jgi:hypothetical protein
VGTGTITNPQFQQLWYIAPPGYQYAYDGIYSVTTVGNATTPWQLTRATNFDSGTNIKNNSVVLVQFGSANLNSQWALQLSNPALPVFVGVTGLPFIANAGTNKITEASYPIWQHEFGWDKIDGSTITAVYSKFQTCDISWTGGNAGGDKSDGANRQFHLIRVEPDFVLSGEMIMTVVGRGYANEVNVTDGATYAFDDTTPKIDIRVQYRQMSLVFESSTAGGHYEMGRILLTADYGDERPAGDIDYYSTPEGSIG